MIDLSSRGLRCRAVERIVDQKGVVIASSEGTVIYELGSDPNNLIHVEWDDGIASLIEPESIVITDSTVTWN